MRGLGSPALIQPGDKVGRSRPLFGLCGAPVGALRWRPPAPPGRHGLLDATECANSCPQVTGLGAFAGPATIDEDCLYLNVFATGKPFFGGLNTVIVWIHGGGNVDGKPLTMTEASSPRAGGPLAFPRWWSRSTIAWACQAGSDGAPRRLNTALTC